MKVITQFALYAFYALTISIAYRIPHSITLIQDNAYLELGRFNLALQAFGTDLSTGFSGRMTLALQLFFAFGAGVALTRHFLGIRGKAIADHFEALTRHPIVIVPALAICVLPLGLQAHRMAAQTFFVPPGPNFILIVVDTLRADYLEAVGDEASIAPNLLKFAQESVVFDSAFSTSSWTRPAIASIASSKTAVAMGITEESSSHRLVPETLTLSEYLRDLNYRTHAVLSNAHYEFGPAQGFESVESRIEPAAKSVEHAILFLEEHPRARKFLQIHIIDPHSPYAYHPGFGSLPEDSEFRSIATVLPTISNRTDADFDSEENLGSMAILSPEELAKMTGAYGMEIAYMDQQLGKLFDYLDASGSLEDTVVIFTADHGEEFLDHGSYFHGGTLFNELIRVPLIVKVPHVTPRRSQQPASLVDIFPTIAELSQQPNARAPEMSGISLVPFLTEGKLQSRPVFSATSFRTDLKLSVILDGVKLIRYASGEPIGLFDLQADPTEQTSLPKDDPRWAQLSQLLDEQGIPAPPQGEALELDAEALENLRALGYHVD